MIGRIKKQHPIGEIRGPNLQKTELSSKILHSKNRSIICIDVKIAVPKGDGGRSGFAKVEDDFKPAQRVSVRFHHSELASVCGMAWAGSKNDQKRGHPCAKSRKKPSPAWERAFDAIAGTGFEPATSGL